MVAPNAQKQTSRTPVANSRSELRYQIPGLSPMITTDVAGLPEIRPGQHIPLSNDEWFDWVPKVQMHRFEVHQRTHDEWSKRDAARMEELRLVKADERYWFYTYPGIFEARSDEDPADMSVVEATEDEAQSGLSRAGMRPYILYPFQDYWITWQRKALRTRGNEGDTITIKSRDMGMTNTAVGMLDYRWMTRPIFQARLLSRVENLVDDTADPDSMFWKADAMLRTTPRWMLNAFVPNFDWLTHRRLMVLENPNNGNMLKGESTNATAGRGRRAAVILLDEFPVMQGFEAIWENTRATTFHRCAVGTVSTEKGMGPYNVVMSGRHAVIYIDSRTGMHPLQDDRWRELERARSSEQGWAREVGMDWFADAGDFVYPDFRLKQVGQYPYVPFGGPVFAAIDDGVHWAIWFLQYIEATGRIHVLDCYRNKGKRTDFYGALLNGLYHHDFTYGEADHEIIKFIQETPIDHFVGDAHAANWEMGTGISVIEDLAQNWNIHVQVDFRKRDYVSRKDDLSELIRYLDFNSTRRMDEGLRCLANYRYRATPEGKEVAREQREPLHNDNSHLATALERFGSLFAGLKPVFGGRAFTWVGDPAW